MKRITHILITLLLTAFASNYAFSGLPELQKEYHVYSDGRQIKINCFVNDKNDDDVYDYLTLRINDDTVIEFNLKLVNSNKSSVLFPKDTRISNFEMKRCEETDAFKLSFGIYDFNSIRVAKFYYDCQKDTAYYDFHPDESDFDDRASKELSFKSDDLSFLGVGLTPNPAKKHIFIKYDPEVVRDMITITISDNKGNKVFEQKYDQKKIKKNRIKIDVQSFKKGVYQVELETLELSLILNFLKK